MASEYDSLLEEAPQSSEYDALLTPEPQESTGVGEIAGNIGRAAWETVKGFVPTSLEQARDLAVSLVPPIQAAKSTYNTLSAIVHGESPLEPITHGVPVAQRIPEIAAAEKTAPFSQERFQAGFGTLADVAMLAGIGHGIAKGVPKTLTEVVKGVEEPIAPKVAPVEPQPMPAVEPVTDRQLMVQPETRFEMVPEPPPEIAPARPIYETIRYQPTERPGAETPPLAPEAFPGISQSAEQARQTARTVETGIESETARIGGEPAPVPEVQPATTAQPLPETTTEEVIPSAIEEGKIGESVQAERPGDGEGGTPAEAGRGGGVQPEAEVVTPKEGEIVPEKVQTGEFQQSGYTAVDTPAETAAKSRGEETGIAARYREDELGPGSVIPGVGKTADQARAWGHDFINKGGNPYDAINQKGPKRELWQDVGIARAEHERLGIEKRNAEAALEANPNDPLAQMAFDNADLAQRQWSKDVQPVLTRAGDALRAASRSYPREINTFSDFTDIVNDHFGGAVELNPLQRAELFKATKAIKKGNLEATEVRQRVTNEAIKKANGKVMDSKSLGDDLRGTMEQLLKDCVL